MKTSKTAYRFAVGLALHIAMFLPIEGVTLSLQAGK